MNRLQADSVAIHQLRIQGAARSGAAGLEGISGQLQQELERAAWPEAPGQSWIFIRQLQAQGPTQRIAGQLVQAARAQVERGDADNVVRFASLAALLAALLQDLTRGQAAGRWYWRRWRHLFRLPLAAAVQQLLVEHLSQLPSISTRLAQLQALTEVWLTLDEAGAGQLLQMLAARSGFQLPDSRQWEQAQANPGVAPQMTALLPGSSLWQYWTPVLRALPPTDARFQLALCLIGQQLAPLMLMQAPASLLSQLTDLVATQLTGAAESRPRPSAAVQEKHGSAIAAAAVRAISAASVFDPPGNAGEQTETQATSDAGASELPLQTNRKATAARTASTSGQPAHAEKNREPMVRRVPSNDVSRSLPSRERSLPDIAPSDLPSVSDASGRTLRSASPNPDFNQFATTQGGLLYLLNFLNRPQAQTLLEENWEALPGGWGWLYRLGQMLQLDERDPIVAFVATQLGLDRPQALDQLPPLPAREALLNLAHRWYGESGLWQPQLLQLNARIQFSPSHLDLYAPLDAVRLPVRLAGLDIDPGWLPWLGRVVSFHYD